MLCTFESVNPIPRAFAAEKLATCAKHQCGTDKRKYRTNNHQSLPSVQSRTDKPSPESFPEQSCDHSCATYLARPSCHDSTPTQPSTTAPLPRPASRPHRLLRRSRPKPGGDPLTINPSHVHRPVAAGGRPPIRRSPDI
jgi:hypothetical protein